MSITRRQFIGTSTGAVIAAGTMARSTVFGANDRVRMACVGLNGRGGEHLKNFSGYARSEVVALCDVDERVLARRSRELEKRTGKKAKLYTDIRDVLADEGVDAISIATPNHWHTLATIWACQNGKDVYVEKPLAHEIWEGRQAVAAAKKYKRIVQHGTQNRSSGRWQRDIKLLHDGFIGPVYMARGLGFKTSGSRDSIGFAKEEDAPPHLHWRLWQGPASEQRYCKNYVHYKWHWFWHYGNGEIGNQGVHQMDIGAWGMNKGLPVKVYSAGGRYTYEDQGETPNTQTAIFTYADGTIFVFDVRNRYTNDEAGRKVGNLFYGSEGYYVEGKGFFNKKDKLIAVPNDVEMPESKNHFENFIDAVISRKQKDINGTAHDGHIASVHCCLANISYRLGRELTFDPKTETFPADEAANGLLRREYEPGFEVPELA